MDQFDLFAVEPEGYKPPKAFAFPSAEWGNRGHSPQFTSVCLRHGQTWNGQFYPARRALLCRSSCLPTRRAYSALAS